MSVASSAKAADRSPAKERAARDRSDWINPILVKESRQAIRGHGFVWTFGLLLLCVWGWTVAGILVNWPLIRFEPYGAELLIGYATISIVPLIIVIPFIAYRSMLDEQESNTFDLLSIATITPNQIVRGKMVTALMQSIVCFSVMGPCLAFTYLLGGIDLRQIAAIVFLLMVSTIVSIAVAQFLATVAFHSLLSVFSSVALIVVLLVFAWTVINFIIAMLDDPGDVIDTLHGRHFSVVASWYAVAFAAASVFLSAAAARLTPPAMNRSASVRKRLVVFTACLAAAILSPLVDNSMPALEKEYLEFGMWVFVVVWTVMGSLLIAERDELSPRVRRSLPANPLARIVWGWTIPGSGTGYLFAVASVFAGLLILAGVGELYAIERTDLAIAHGLYVTFYLGLGRLLFQRIRRRYPGAGFAVSLLAVAVILFVGNVALLVVPLSAGGWSIGSGYSLYAILCWPWSIDELRTNPSRSTDILLTLAGLTTPVVLLNARAIASQLFADRSVEPQRVMAARRIESSPPVVDPLAEDA